MHAPFVPADLLVLYTADNPKGNHRTHPMWLMSLISGWDRGPKVRSDSNIARLDHRRPRRCFSSPAPRLGARHIIVTASHCVQASCGFGVPLMDSVGQRHTALRWAEAKGAEGIATCQRDKNTISIDGLRTPLADQFKQDRVWCGAVTEIGSTVVRGSKTATGSRSGLRAASGSAAVFPCESVADRWSCAL
jgi:hypothetical protein